MEDISGQLTKLVWDSLIKAAIGKLFAAFPGLAWGPIGYIVSYIIVLFGDILYKHFRDLWNLEKIFQDNDSYRVLFERKSTTLKIIAFDKGVDSPEFREALIESKEALSRFIKYAPARP